jgi:hypothetical protein
MNRSTRIGGGLLLACLTCGGMGLIFLPFLLPVALLIGGVVWLARRSMAGTMLMLALVVMVGCYDRHAQESAIVRFVEAKGSGDISTYSAPGLEQWFSERPALGAQVYGFCAPKYATSGANWATSAEGSVCMAARPYAPKIPVVVVADQTTW